MFGTGWLSGVRRRMRSSRWSVRAGFSLAETTIILSAGTVLAATAAPSVMDYVAQARLIKAAGDEQVLISAVSRLLFDVGRFSPVPGGKEPIMLVGPGEDFTPGGSADGSTATGAAAVPAAAGTAASNVVGPAQWMSPPDGVNVQNLEDHLVTNVIGYRVRGEEAFAKGWGGPYLDKVQADPWGHRYCINIGALGKGPVIIMSAGPDGAPQTPFVGNGLRSGGDDIIGLLGSRR